MKVEDYIICRDIGINSIVHIEILAIHDGLLLAWGLGIKFLIVEKDG